MEKYKTRPGVVLTEIAGEYALVAAKKLLDTCPYVTQLSESSAFLWRQLEKGATQEDLEKVADEEYEIEDTEEASKEIRAFLQQMSDLHYLILQEEENA